MRKLDLLSPQNPKLSAELDIINKLEIKQGTFLDTASGYEGRERSMRQRVDSE